MAAAPLAEGAALVYGAGRSGLMGAVSQVMLDAVGTVVGVVPRDLHRRGPPSRT